MNREQLRGQFHELRLATDNAYRGGDWRKVPIVECGQPLVELPAAMCRPYYVQQGMTFESRVFVREEVARRLATAQVVLGGVGLELKVYGGWRSIELQEALWWWCMQEFTAAKHGLARQFVKLTFAQVKEAFGRLSAEVRAAMHQDNLPYVSYPNNDPRHPSPHSTGGAVDVMLFRDGRAVDLGVPFDHMDPPAGLFFHLDYPGYFPPAVEEARERLAMAMAIAGFSAYPFEYWHFNFGNQMDGLVVRRSARFGYAGGPQ